MNTSGMGTLVISVYKKYGVAQFEGGAQIEYIWYRGLGMRELCWNNFRNNDEVK